jgi:hypothetical protein
MLLVTRCGKWMWNCPRAIPCTIASAASPAFIDAGIANSLCAVSGYRHPFAGPVVGADHVRRRRLEAAGIRPATGRTFHIAFAQDKCYVVWIIRKMIAAVKLLPWTD